MVLRHSQRFVSFCRNKDTRSRWRVINLSEVVKLKDKPNPNPVHHEMLSRRPHQTTPNIELHHRQSKLHPGKHPPDTGVSLCAFNMSSATPKDDTPPALKGPSALRSIIAGSTAGAVEIGEQIRCRVLWNGK